MTIPAANHPDAVFPGAQYVGKAFVDQYYYVLGISPESLYKFYNESSLLGRLDTNGTMTSVTTLKDIDEKIQSVDCKNSKPEIETVDAQDSYKAGVIVIVTGCVIGADNVRRRFSQTFFLAPQENGYFVLNDILRYVEEIGQLEVNFKPVDSDGDSVPSATLTSISDNTRVSASHACDPSNTFGTEDAEVCEALRNGEICSHLDNEKHSVMVPEIVNEQQTDSSQNGTVAAISSDSSVVQQEKRSYASNTFKTEDAEVCEALGNGEICSPLDNEKHSVMVPEFVNNEQRTDSSQNSTVAAISSDSSVVQQENRSYASILKVSKAAANPASNLRWAPTKTSPNTLGSPKLSPELAASFPASDSGPKGGNPQEDVEGHSIYIRNLPSNATVAHVIEEFSKFGPIKYGGVQLKIHRQYGYHYGFVEFESVDSMQNAIKESPIVIGRRHVVVEEKLSTFKVGSSGSTSGRDEFQNSFRGRGNIEGRGYGRSEFRNTHNFSSRPTSNSGRSSEYRYQRVERV